MTKDEEIQALKTAFEEFSVSSEVLSQSYKELQQQAAVLSERLAQAELEKQQQEDRNRILFRQFQQLFESMPVGVLLLNDEGVVVMVNQAATSLFTSSVVGTSWFQVVQESFAPQSDDGHEVTMVSGRRVRVETSSLGNTPGQLVILVDLTETHKLQRQLSHHERLSNMGQMVAALAHQIRTPLSTATLYAGHLQNPSLNEVSRTKFAAKVMDRLQNIERQIRDMLIFSKSDIKLENKLPLSHFLETLKSHAQEVCDQSNVSLAFTAPLDVASYLLQCNNDTLIGAIMNLLNNAIDAQDASGEITLHSYLDEDKLFIKCVDQGVGMTQEALDKIQEGFVTTKQHGTGLGIMVVKAVARAHHGQFNIQSVFGEGTTASICLPLIKV